MTTSDNLAWRTSTRSTNGEKCVEVALAAHGVVIRHGKHPDAGAITFPIDAWATFVREACNGSSSENGVATITKIGTDTLVRSVHNAVELRFDEGEWSAFVAGAADGEFESDFVGPLPAGEIVRNTNFGNAKNLIQVGGIEQLNLVLGSPQAPAVDNGRPPLAITATARNERRDPLWIVDCDIDQVPAYDEPGWHEWVRAHQLDLPLDNRLDLHVEGTSPQAVRLQQLRFRVVERSTPRGVVLHVDNQVVGAALVPRWFCVELGSGTEIVPRPRFDEGTDFPYAVHQSEPEWFRIDLHCGADDLAWVVELEWFCAGHSGTLHITDNDRPFRSTSISGRPVYLWDPYRPHLGWHQPRRP
jgi:hypothetical protein